MLVLVLLYCFFLCNHVPMFCFSSPLVAAREPRSSGLPHPDPDQPIVEPLVTGMRISDGCRCPMSRMPRDRQQKRDCAANQVPPSPLNNTSVLSDMEVPEGWVLHGRAPKVTKASPWSSTQISLAASLSLAGILRLLITGYIKEAWITMHVSTNYDAAKKKDKF